MLAAARPAIPKKPATAAGSTKPATSVNKGPRPVASAELARPRAAAVAEFGPDHFLDLCL